MTDTTQAPAPDGQASTTPSKAKALMIGHWAARLVVAGIFVMGIIPKFTGNAAELVERLPGGQATAIAIGVFELVAVVLLFVPKTTIIGSVLALVIMLGAVASHLVGPVGMEGDVGSMIYLATGAFVAAAIATGLAWARGARPGVAPRHS